MNYNVEAEGLAASKAKHKKLKGTLKTTIANAKSQIEEITQVSQRLIVPKDNDFHRPHICVMYGASLSCLCRIGLDWTGLD